MDGSQTSPLLPIVVGWALGILTTVLGVVLTQWLTTSRKKRRTANLLLQEIRKNKHSLLSMKIVKELDKEGKLHVEEEEGEALFIMRVSENAESWFSYPKTDIYSETLKDQGLLSQRTLKYLHKYHHCINGTGGHLNQAMKSSGDQRLDHLRAAADYAQTALMWTKTLQQRLEAEASINPLNQPAATPDEGKQPSHAPRSPYQTMDARGIEEIS